MGGEVATAAASRHRIWRTSGTLHANNRWYRHRNRVIDTVFTRCDNLARMDRLDADAK